jgi:hypothetical protein
MNIESLATLAGPAFAAGRSAANRKSQRSDGVTRLR